MALKTFKDVQAFFAPIPPGSAPHGAFWATLSYDEFVNGNVPGGARTADPNTGLPLPILAKGHSDNSNIIAALSGKKGSYWDNTDPNAPFPQMPKGGPYFSAAQIQEVSDWIDAGCPE
jgi:hypothetical protein